MNQNQINNEVPKTSGNVDDASTSQSSKTANTIGVRRGRGRRWASGGRGGRGGKGRIGGSGGRGREMERSGNAEDASTTRGRDQSESQSGSQSGNKNET